MREIYIRANSDLLLLRRAVSLQQTNTKPSIFIMTCLKFYNVPQFSFLANVALCLVLLCEK